MRSGKQGGRDRLSGASEEETDYPKQPVPEAVGGPQEKPDGGDSDERLL